jgi:D-alanyl-D-alanine carboxypeptidase (penicillin-binding protein 5/6)
VTLTRRAVARLVATAVCCAALLAVPASPAAAAAPGPVLPVTADALYAPQTRQLLYGDNAERELPIASTTKLMTALITLQHVHRLSTIFTQNNWYPAAADSQLGLVPGERMSVHDLLLAMMLPSDDDAAEDLAYNVGHGSVARFVGMMNAQAEKLGLTNTHYSTPIGLDAPGNYSTAGDLVKLAEYDLTHSKYFARIVALKSAVIRAGDDTLTITNRNDLVAEYPWIDGVKTGHTNGAGYVLVAAAHRDGMPLISAVLGTDSESERDATTLALLNYGFANFALRTPVRTDQVMMRPGVHNEPGMHVSVIAERGYQRILPRSDRLSLRVQAPHQLTGPLPAQAVVGSVSVIDDGRVLDRIPLLLRQRVPAVSALTMAARFVARPVTLLLIFAAAGGGALFWRGTRRRRRVDRQRREVETA